MARLNLTAEGQTEQVFASHVLRPRLAQCGVYLSKPRLTALCKKKGQVHRGGVSRYLPLKNDIRRWLREDRNRDVFFTTMIDLYGLPADFPAYDRAREMKDPYQRVAVLESAFRDDVGDARFIPYLQMHEFEALLLADPSAFGRYNDQYACKVDGLVLISEEFDGPELIDDGEETAPSKRIGRMIPQYLAGKPVDGPGIASLVELDAIRAKCRHFNDWLTKLERLGAP